MRCWKLKYSNSTVSPVLVLSYYDLKKKKIDLFVRYVRTYVETMWNDYKVWN